MSRQPAEDILYAGPDLHRAAAESAVRMTLADRLAGVRNACAIGAEIAAGRLRGRAAPSWELVLADSDAHATVAVYAGTGVNRDWCLSTVPGSRIRSRIGARTPSELANALAEIRGEADIVFTEGVSDPLAAADVDAGRGRAAGPAGKALSFVIPAWVKQRLRVTGDWARQLAGLRRDTRQEVARVLRKYGYSCRLSHDAADHADFYDRLYRPYVTRRFGDGALVVDRSRFLVECGRGILLRLMQQNEVIGTTLLRPLGRTLAVVWSALDPDGEPGRLRGATDAMDYFSLLYAHLRGCRWLDFGPSRPDLFDGALRYKAKWGAELHTGLVPQAEIRCTCPDRSRAQAGFLTGHAFLAKRSGGLRGMFFVAGDAEPNAFRARLAVTLTGGVRDYRVLALSPPTDRLRAVVSGMDADVMLQEPQA